MRIVHANCTSTLRSKGFWRTSFLTQQYHAHSHARSMLRALAAHQLITFGFQASGSAVCTSVRRFELLSRGSEGVAAHAALWQVSTAVVEPYNSVLSTHSLLEHTDVGGHARQRGRLRHLPPLARHRAPHLHQPQQARPRCALADTCNVLPPLNLWQMQYP